VSEVAEKVIQGRHCEERSDVAIQKSLLNHFPRLLRPARKDEQWGFSAAYLCGRPGNNNRPYQMANGKPGYVL
jgi:hypothetical protein